MPLEAERLEPFFLPEGFELEPDARFTGKIKWYVQPLIFGGDPEDEANLIWVDSRQHAGLVIWWNDQFTALRA